MRKPIISRNINCRRFIVRCAILSKGTVEDRVFYLYKPPATYEKALELITKLNDDYDVKPVAIRSHQDIHRHAFMPIDEFLKASKDLKPEKE